MSLSSDCPDLPLGDKVPLTAKVSADSTMDSCFQFYVYPDSTQQTFHLMKYLVHRLFWRTTSVLVLSKTSMSQLRTPD